MVDLHADGGIDPVIGIALLVAAVGVVGYLALVSANSRPWPRRRTLCWLTGSLCVVAGAWIGPAMAFVDYPAHMITHLMIGMVAPLLFVLAAPVTLLLRRLPAVPARRVSRALQMLPVRVLTEPTVAAAVNVGGLWLLYTSGLYPTMHHSPAVYVIVHAHLLVAGYLFTVSMISLDPLPHRRSSLHRSVVLVAALAAHDVLAKFLYAHPPAEVTTSAAESGAMIMYYGGDLVDVTIMVVLCARWYRAAGRLRQPAATA